MTRILNPVFAGAPDVEIALKSIIAFECSDSGEVVIRTAQGEGHSFPGIPWDQFVAGAEQVLIDIRDAGGEDPSAG